MRTFHRFAVTVFLAVVLIAVLAVGVATIRLTGPGPRQAGYRYGTRPFVPGSSAYATRPARSIWNVLDLAWSRVYLAYNQMAVQASVRPYDRPFLTGPEGSQPIAGSPVTRPLSASDLADLRDPLAPNAQTLALGHRAYRIACFPCHGENYDGWAPVGESYAPAPADLRDADVQRQTDAELFRIISDGSPAGFCPPQRVTLTTESRWAVVTLLRNLPSRSSVPPDMPLATPSAKAFLSELAGDSTSEPPKGADP